MNWISLHAYIGQKGAAILWWQMTIRAVLIFLFGLALLRIFGRRAFNKSSSVDIILAILVGSNLSRALTGNASFGPTVAATTAIVLLYWVITELAYRSSGVGWLVKGRAERLVSNGKVNWQAMQRHGFSEGDLAEALREKGITQLQHVAAAYMERDGSVSVIRKH